METPALLINHYDMKKHPEGGYYTETYRSEDFINLDRGKRSLCTAIKFLLTKDEISHFHRIESDEGWHFHLGDPLKIIEITSQGTLIETILGTDFQEGQLQHYFVKAGHWFAAISLGNFSFFGCTVSPGFDFKDFELAQKRKLEELFPQHQEVIKTYSLN